MSITPWWAYDSEGFWKIVANLAFCPALLALRSGRFRVSYPQTGPALEGMAE